MAQEPVPQGYPSPQVEVHLARDVGPHIPRSPGRSPIIDLIPEAEWTEVGNATKGRTIGGIIWDSSKWLMREAVMPAIYKLVPQGASEIAGVLFTGQPFTPYGPTLTPVPMPEEPAVATVGLEPSNGLENYPATAAYEDLVAAYMARGVDEQTQELSR